jgi:hypothetical protein
LGYHLFLRTCSIESPGHGRIQPSLRSLVPATTATVRLRRQEIFFGEQSTSFLQCPSCAKVKDAHLSKIWWIQKLGDLIWTVRRCAKLFSNMMSVACCARPMDETGGGLLCEVHRNRFRFVSLGRSVASTIYTANTSVSINGRHALAIINHSTSLESVVEISSPLNDATQSCGTLAASRTEAHSCCEKETK